MHPRGEDGSWKAQGPLTSFAAGPTARVRDKRHKLAKSCAFSGPRVPQACPRARTSIIAHGSVPRRRKVCSSRADVWLLQEHRGDSTRLFATWTKCVWGFALRRRERQTKEPIPKRRCVLFSNRRKRRGVRLCSLCSLLFRMGTTRKRVGPPGTRRRTSDPLACASCLYLTAQSSAANSARICRKTRYLAW
jgi:hypothetical protein